MQNEDVFDDEEISKLNKSSYEYFENLKNVKKCSLQNFKLFWKLYKYENLSYSLQNYLILNIPVLAKILFKVKKGLKSK